MATRNRIVRLENVGMRYGMGAEVLQDIGFTLEPGSFHFLTGPSGAGKSSLLKLLYLAHRPSRGHMTLFGEDVMAAKRQALPQLRRRIGVVFQDYRLLDHLSAIDNVALPLRIAGGASDSMIREHVEELLVWVGLKDRMHARPQTLSGGEKQRVAIARAVIAKPDLLLADEPTGNVDPAMARRLMHLFVELNKLGTTTVIATHDRELVAEMGKPTMTLSGGRLMLDGEED
ncbi:MAG: cell division ATP-binding protein FtsE [Rhodothalassiaceae bacterium]